MEASDIQLKPGEVRRIRLGGLGSAGYTWGHRTVGPSGVVEVTVVPGEEDVRRPPPGGAMPSSYSLDQVLVIRAIGMGSARVEGFLHRPWEKTKPPLKEVAFAVTVE